MNNFRSNILQIVLGIVVVVAVFLIILAAAKYFKLLPMGILKQDQPSPQAIKPPSVETKTKFICPLLAFPCPKATIITKSTDAANFHGLGYKSKIFKDAVAILAGDYTISLKQIGSPKWPKSYPGTTVKIKSQNQNLEITYEFQGLPDKKLASPSGYLSEGQVIGKLEEGFTGYRTYGEAFSLVLYMQSLPDLKYLNIKPSEATGSGIILQ
ncbi:MAG: hypothetical protein AAB414_05585 [Patescibacteria group bacterium]